LRISHYNIAEKGFESLTHAQHSGNRNREFFRDKQGIFLDWQGILLHRIKKTLPLSAMLSIKAIAIIYGGGDATRQRRSKPVLIGKLPRPASPSCHTGESRYPGPGGSRLSPG